MEPIAAVTPRHYTSFSAAQLQRVCESFFSYLHGWQIDGNLYNLTDSEIKCSLTCLISKTLTTW